MERLRKGLVVCLTFPVLRSTMKSVQFLFYGYRNFGSDGFNNMKNKEELPDMTNKTVMVTGGNAGLGFDVCKRLASLNANVLLVARNEERGKKAVEDIGKDNVKLLLCDVSIQSQVHQLIEQVPALDVLILNAGILPKDERVEVEGVERVLATNIVNNVILTEGLMEKLKASEDGRVIIISSGGGLTEPLCKNEQEYEAGKFTGMTAYARTKRMQMALTKYYARHYPEVGFYSMHPGWADTPGVRTQIPGFYDTFKNKFRTQEQGADTICWLASSSSVSKENSGALFRDRDVEMEHFTWAGTKYTQEDEEQMYKFLKSKVKESN